MLADVAILAAFFFSIFGITCVELFRGLLVYRCGNPDFSSAVTDAQGLLMVRSYSHAKDTNR